MRTPAHHPFALSLAVGRASLQIVTESILVSPKLVRIISLAVELNLSAEVVVQGSAQDPLCDWREGFVSAPLENCCYGGIVHEVVISISLRCECHGGTCHH